MIVKNLYKSFDGVKAVHDFSLTLETGKVTSLIGPNGAGKTTVFNIVTGFLPASKGDVLFYGKSIIGTAPWKIARSGSEEIGPPDLRDDVGFSVSTIAGGLFLLPVATGETEKRAIEIGTIMSADQRLGVSTIWELASK